MGEAAGVSSTGLVRYRTNDYSIPTAYGFQDVVVKGFVEEVVILCGGSEIARHPRCFGEPADLREFADHQLEGSMPEAARQ